jgi:hypothetical protein
MESTVNKRAHHLTNDPMNFSRQLIKGRITETVFEQMIRSEGRYDVIPFGYEHTVPTLAQYQHLSAIRRVMDKIADAPDFALVLNDKKEVYLVEVKYRSTLDSVELKALAERMLARWNPSWLFIATPTGFYCAPCSAIAKDGSISYLSESWVTKERQKEHLALLNEFERK